MNIRTLICAAALAFTAFSAGAVTVTGAGGTYDINSDTLFTGSAIDLDGGAGSHVVTFYSLVDPVDGQVNASITLGILGTFTDLTVSWYDTITDLVISWSDSTAGVEFDFDVSTVPLPAGGLLLLTALGGLGISRRRKTA